ncbi:LLM class flavin-dependent oxidoreductase [Mycobacterium sp. DL440]|uniref:LLM class flavin-dependent oxidoreductase n=1 Tax=Mycobacterium sp. DL440 TaxID=2675523 RepID=UPI00141E9D3C|nr:LLM class flavin-dependent oxidoreductase [Mycobacterium sp. DL440]
MKFGTFHLPYSLDYADGKRPAKDVIDWDLQVVEWADRYGLDEAFFAEHFTVGAEPSPAPDAMIAAASQRTSRIRLGAGAHLLPYHNPIALAHRIMWLDHMTGGRYIAGMAPGAYPSDAQMFSTGKNNNEMMIEALDIIESIWTKPAPFTIAGKYWSVDMPDYDPELKGPHLRPLQDPHPPIAMTGMQPKSPTLALAGERGYLPMSQQLGNETLRQQWATYDEAARAAGHQTTRSDWRIFRDFFVADTDEQARDAVINGAAGKTWEAILLPVFKKMNLLPMLAGDMDPEKVDLDWLADNFWLVGSPATVREKVREFNKECGGTGTIISFTYDYSDTPELYERNFELMGKEVMPALADL